MSYHRNGREDHRQGEGWPESRRHERQNISIDRADATDEVSAPAAPDRQISWKTGLVMDREIAAGSGICVYI